MNTLQNSLLHQRLNMIEIFSSIQGETSWSGLPMLFLRLAACNLRCHWCDTPYSFERGTSMTMAAILEQIEAAGLPLICVTGGEPLLQKNIYPLMTFLCDSGYRLTLETGGSLSTTQVDSRVHVILDIKCPGSGMQDKNYWPNLERLREQDEVKFVLKDRQDYDYAKRILTQHLKSCPAGILFSPVHNILDPKDLIQWILADKLKVRLNLQIHKFIWSPETRGV
jgi:7-carboxy-7-deazaguanine synthase